MPQTSQAALSATKRARLPGAAAQVTCTSDTALATLARRHRALGDDLRLGLLRLLRQSSYTVSELAEIVAMTQPALSHHLKLLHEAQLVARRREGNNIYYRRAAIPGDTALAAIYAELDALPVATAQSQRRDAVLDLRRADSQRFFDDNVTAFEEQQARISQADVYSQVVVELAEQLVAQHDSAMEIGPGDGELLTALAARFQRVVAIDHSERMLAQTASAVSGSANVVLQQQTFEALPHSADQDLVVAAMVLHHSPNPAGFFSQAAAVLKPQGTLIVAELCSHDQDWAHKACGDLWLGFEPEELLAWARDCAFSVQASEFLAQRNGFRIQIHALALGQGDNNQTTLN